MIKIADGNGLFMRDTNLVEARVDHIVSLDNIHKNLKKDPEYYYCYMFYDTFFDLLMHGY